MLKCESGRWALGGGGLRAPPCSRLCPGALGIALRGHGALGATAETGTALSGNTIRNKAKVNQGFALRFEFGGKITS